MGRGGKYALTLVCAFFVLYLCLYPREMIGAVGEGLLLWYQSVLPSLFPFLIVSGVLIEIGAVERLGRALEPVMRPLFRVPGCGAFVLVMGSLSGYPVGARLTAQLRAAGQLTRTEAQRLVSFCNNSGPLFMLGAVGTSVLGSLWAGYFIMATNYIAALALGLLFRFYSPNRLPNHLPRVRNAKAGSAVARTGTGGSKPARQTTQVKPLGQLLGDTVRSSIEVAVQIGGFIMLFSAVLALLRLSGLLGGAGAILRAATGITGISQSFAEAILSGVLEITNGIKLGAAAEASIRQQVGLAGALAAFGGLSIFAQTAAFLAQTDISARVYFFAKLMQAALQAAAGYLLYPLFAGRIAEDIAALKTAVPAMGGQQTPQNPWVWSMLLLAAGLLLLVACALRRKKRAVISTKSRAEKN